MSARRQLSTATRVALGTALVLTLGVAAVTFVSYAAVSRHLEAELDASLLAEADAYSAALAQDAPETEAALVEASRLYLTARTQTGAGSAPILLARLSDGTVISNSDIRIESVLAATDRSFRTVAHDGVEYRVLSAPVRASDGTALGTFYAALSQSGARAIRTELGGTLLAIGLGVALVGALLSVVAARAALAPLARVAATVDRVTQARLTERIEYRGANDEVGTMVRALNAMLERLEAAFGEQRRFVADASHELRTPLAIIRGHLELLERTESLPDLCVEPIEVLRDETRRMQRMVDDLLLLARLDDRSQVRSFQPLSVEVLLAEVAARARELGDAEVASTAPDEAWVEGDPDLLEQALMNLAANAMRAVGPDGHVRLAAALGAATVRITVADDGPGFPPAELSRVFDRFYRLAERGSGATGGSGLGLAIARRLVELHAGTIAAGNRPEGGAELTVELPRAEPA